MGRLAVNKVFIS